MGSGQATSARISWLVESERPGLYLFDCRQLDQFGSTPWQALTGFVFAKHCGFVGHNSLPIQKDNPIDLEQVRAGYRLPMQFIRVWRPLSGDRKKKHTHSEQQIICAFLSAGGSIASGNALSGNASGRIAAWGSRREILARPI
ncbi:MAG: hypothetical protein AAFX04_10110 [Pseudomonadota bacterium]